MNYQTAVEHVVAHQQACWASITQDKTITLYIICHKSDLEEPDEPPYFIEFVGGLVGSSVGEEEIYQEEDLPDEVRLLDYQVSACANGAWSWYQVEYALQLLQKGSLI